MTSLQLNIHSKKVLLIGAKRFYFLIVKWMTQRQTSLPTTSVNPLLFFKVQNQSNGPLNLPPCFLSCGDRCFSDMWTPAAPVWQWKVCHSPMGLRRRGRLWRWYRWAARHLQWVHCVLGATLTEQQQQDSTISVLCPCNFFFHLQWQRLVSRMSSTAATASTNVCQRRGTATARLTVRMELTREAVVN